MAQSQYDLALRQLREMVFSGELNAGSNHFEADLAQRLGMSRTPVREATLTLQAQGLVDVQPRRGMRVLPVEAEDMADIYDVLGVLESLAAKRAAQRGYTAADLGVAYGFIEDMDAALDRRDLDAWAEADQGFHEELVRLSGNPRLIESVARYSDQARRARLLTMPLRPLPTKSNEDHRAVMEAIAQGDHARAQSIHAMHRMNARELIVELIRNYRLCHL